MAGFWSPWASRMSYLRRRHAPEVDVRTKEEKAQAARLRAPVAREAEDGVDARRAGRPRRHRGADHPGLPAAGGAASAAFHGLGNSLSAPAAGVAARDPAP